MGRIYVVTFEEVAVSAVQDLLQIKGAAGKMLQVLSLSVAASDTTAPSSQMLAVRARFLPATVTDGSGGSTPTPQKTDPGDSGASFTALANSTTKATTNGTAVTLLEDACHVLAGYEHRFIEPPPVGPSESLVWELLSTVSGTVHLSGRAVVREIGG